MHLQIDLSMIISFSAVIGTVIAYITAANKIRFEVDLLKKQNETQFKKIDVHNELLIAAKSSLDIFRSDSDARFKSVEDGLKEAVSNITKNDAALSIMKDKGSAPTERLKERVESLETDMRKIQEILNNQNRELATIKAILERIESDLPKRRARV